MGRAFTSVINNLINYAMPRKVRLGRPGWAGRVRRVLHSGAGAATPSRGSAVPVPPAVVNLDDDAEGFAMASRFALHFVRASRRWWPAPPP